MIGRIAEVLMGIGFVSLMVGVITYVVGRSDVVLGVTLLIFAATSGTALIMCIARDILLNDPPKDGRISRG